MSLYSRGRLNRNKGRKANRPLRLFLGSCCRLVAHRPLFHSLLCSCCCCNSVNTSPAPHPLFLRRSAVLLCCSILLLCPAVSASSSTSTVQQLIFGSRLLSVVLQMATPLQPDLLLLIELFSSALLVSIPSPAPSILLFYNCALLLAVVA